jgi:lysophospholipase L1-like esterase
MSTLLDASGNARNGVTGGATGPTLGVSGIGNDKTAVSFPGSAAFINWYSTSLAGAFSGAEGTLIVWSKVSGAGVWSDGTARYIARLSADGSNDIRILRSSSNNNAVLIQHIAGGTSRFIYANSNASTAWQMYGLTWSVSAGQVFAYVNGAIFESGLASLGAPGTWAGSLATTLCTIGAGDTSSNSVWSGSIGHAVLLNRAATPAEMMSAYLATISPKVITVLGDSISANATNDLKWHLIARDGYNSGNTSLISHAVSGYSILGNLANEVTAATNDRANTIILHIGTNDETGTGIQAQVEASLAQLKTDHPSATIYYMNVLPRWTDSGGGTPVDKSYVRSPIAAACTAQGVTCWDTYTTPWITAAQTTDGLHPNAAGHAAIAAEVLSRL